MKEKNKDGEIEVRKGKERIQISSESLTSDKNHINSLLSEETVHTPSFLSCITLFQIKFPKGEIKTNEFRAVTCTCLSSF